MVGGTPAAGDAPAERGVVVALDWSAAHESGGEWPWRSS